MYDDYEEEYDKESKGEREVIGRVVLLYYEMFAYFIFKKVSLL